MTKFVDIIMPEDQQEGTKSVLGRWLKQVGDTVQHNEPLVEITTDKVTLEVAAPASGVLAEILTQPNQDVDAGVLLGRISQESADSVAAKPISSSSNGASKAAAGGNRSSNESSVEDLSQQLSPAVRQLISEHDLDISTIKGSGRGGRITYEDAVQAIAKPFRQGTAADSGSSPTLQTPKASQPDQQSEKTKLSGRKVPHTPMRKMIADHMVQSLLHTAPHVTTVFEVDLSAVLAHRASVSNSKSNAAIKPTLTAYFIQAAVAAIKAVPEINSRWHDDGLEVFSECNIGVATATGGINGQEAGLVVPVLHNAHLLDLHGTAAALQVLVDRARTGALVPTDLHGGTFTISNHGVSGSLLATPIIINQPQSAILGIGKLENRPVMRRENGVDTVHAVPKCYVTLTIDHRVLDGFKANLFMSKFVEVLENWP